MLISRVARRTPQERQQPLQTAVIAVKRFAANLARISKLSAAHLQYPIQDEHRDQEAANRAVEYCNSVKPWFDDAAPDVTTLDLCQKARADVFRHAKSVSAAGRSLSFGTPDGRVRYDRRSRLDRRLPAVSKPVDCRRVSRQMNRR